MKRNIIITIIIIGMPALLHAQNEIDALRYSQNYFGGTTRASSMAGAFGALGGDFSSLSINPAGIGVYRSTEFTISPTLMYDKMESTFLGNRILDSKYQFYLNNLGVVSTINTGNESGFKSFTFGVGYNQLNNFQRNTLMQGRQEAVVGPVSSLPPPQGVPSSSYLDNFVNNANDNNWSEFYEELAWKTDVLPYDTDLEEYWNDLADAGYGQWQRQRLTESGGIGEYAFSFGANYEDKFYMGATFGLHRLRYSRLIDHYEEDDREEIDYFDSFTFREDLETFGTGYTFKMGMIYRPISLIRIGAAFHIPTFYKIREDFYTEMDATFDSEPSANERTPMNTFDYWLRTPYRAIGSVAIQLPRFAVISVDYEYVDYTSSYMDSHDYAFIDENQTIKTIYKPSSNIRAGGEVHFGALYLRGGVAFYGSPFESAEINSGAYDMLGSGGIGFRSENVFFDMGYSMRFNKSTYYMYPEEIFGATLNSRKNMFMTTLGFRF